jgi:hypothetical protein
MGPLDGFSAGGYQLVEFDRRQMDPWFLRGFVLAWNGELTLLHALDFGLFRLNGYAVFRNSDVKKWRTFPEDDFLARAARLHRLHPSKPAGVTIHSMREALSTAGKAFPLITIHRERINKRVCFVGKFVRTSRSNLAILEISPQAEWEPEETFSIGDITLLEFGGEYEKLLYRMARQPKTVRR